MYDPFIVKRGNTRQGANALSLPGGFFCPVIPRQNVTVSGGAVKEEKVASPRVK